MGYPSRRTEHIIRSIRRETGNESFSATNGIPTRDLEEYLVDAQDDLQTAIINAHSTRAFPARALLDVVSASNEIALPSDFHSSGGLIKVEFSASGNARDFYELRQVTLAEIHDTATGNPSVYSRRGDTLVLSGTPQASITGGIRVTYVKQLPRPSIRRGVVNSVTLDTSARTITALAMTIDLTLATPYDPTGLLEDDYISIVSAEGVVKMAGIPITAISAPPFGLFTIRPGFVYAVGETIAAGDYIVSGKYASSHPQWPAQVERFLRRFGVLRVKMRDSNDDLISEDALLAQMRDQIVEDYVSLNADILRVPEINEDE